MQLKMVQTGNDLLCRILWQWARASMKMQYQDAHPQPCQGTKQQLSV